MGAIMILWPNKIVSGNRHRAFSFDGAMKFKHRPCNQRQSPVAVPELDRWRSATLL